MVHDVIFKIARFGLVPFLAIAAMAITVPTASAHARYTRSEPADGATVNPGPFVLKAWFSQELMLRSAIGVTDAAGATVDLGDGHVDQDDPDRKVMLVSIPALGEGVYTVSWTSVSADDGHDATGTFTFTVGASADAIPVAPTGQHCDSVS